MKERLLTIFTRLLEFSGSRNWWPGETKLEIVVGAILTQNTSWKNVEKTIAQMKEKNLLEVKALYEIDKDILAEVIRPSGFYNLKSSRLKNFISFFYERFGGSFERLGNVTTSRLREMILGINGIGEETADSILLYALEKPVFVVDAYTKRFLVNHRLYDGDLKYQEVQRFFADNLPADTYLYNEFHALIVFLCQQYCRKSPLCGECPISGL